MEININTDVPIVIFESPLSHDAKLYTVECFHMHLQGFKGIKDKGSEINFNFTGKKTFQAPSLIFNALDFNEINHEQALVLLYFAYVNRRSNKTHGIIKVNRENASKRLGISKTKFDNIIQDLFNCTDSDGVHYLEQLEKKNTYYSYLFDEQKQMELQNQVGFLKDLLNPQRNNYQKWLHSVGDFPCFI